METVDRLNTNNEIIDDKTENNKKEIENDKMKTEKRENQGELANLRKKRRDHSNTTISNKEKEIIDRLKKKAEKGQKEAIRKLIWVSLIGVLFMSGEFVGGYISNSTAIMSDAAHMLSDFLGFGISMISIIISRRQPTNSLSYGYHRAEIVGALVSVVLIWGLTAWLVHEAIDKIIKEDKNLNATVMLITAGVGLLCNISMGHILHSAGGHHLGHSHGCSGHSHSHESHEENDKNKNKRSKKKVEPLPSKNDLTDPLIHDHSGYSGLEKTIENINSDRNDAVLNVENIKEANKIKDKKKKHHHEHKHSKKDTQSDNHNCHNNHQFESNNEHNHSENHNDHCHKLEKHSHDEHEKHSHHEHEKHSHDEHEKHSHHGNEKHSHDEHDKHSHDEHDKHSHHGHEKHSHNEHDKHSHHEHHNKNESKNANQNDKHDHCKGSNHHGNNPSDSHEHDHSDHCHHHAEHHHEEEDHDHHGHDNMNIKAAMIHVIGDIIQSVGVLIAAIVLFFYPNYWFIDPICTFLFSVLVLFTTIPIMKECIKVFMEATPNNIDIIKLTSDLLKIYGVLEIHDLHVWTLKAGVYSLSCHIKSEDPMSSLKRATRMLNTKYKILHTTIQVEDSNDTDIEFDCKPHH